MNFAQWQQNTASNSNTDDNSQRGSEHQTSDQTGGDSAIKNQVMKLMRQATYSPAALGKSSRHGAKKDMSGGFKLDMKQLEELIGKSLKRQESRQERRPPRMQEQRQPPEQQKMVTPVTKGILKNANGKSSSKSKQSVNLQIKEDPKHVQSKKQMEGQSPFSESAFTINLSPVLRRA